jgi:hypothetical protein
MASFKLTIEEILEEKDTDNEPSNEDPATSDNSL